MRETRDGKRRLRSRRGRTRTVRRRRDRPARRRRQAGQPARRPATRPTDGPPQAPKARAAIAIIVTKAASEASSQTSPKAATICRSHATLPKNAMIRTRYVLFMFLSSSAIGQGRAAPCGQLFGGGGRPDRIVGSGPPAAGRAADRLRLCSSTEARPCTSRREWPSSPSSRRSPIWGSPPSARAGLGRISPIRRWSRWPSSPWRWPCRRCSPAAI